MLARLASKRHIVIQPAKLQFLPDAHICRGIADTLAAPIANVGARGHQGPEARGILACTNRGAGIPGRIIQVRQANIVPVLVSEYAQTAVLRLNSVVIYPNTGGVVGDCDRGIGRRTTRPGIKASQGVKVAVYHRSIYTPRCEECIPAMAPDCIRALVRIASGLVATCMNNLEVVDVAIGLIEVAIAIIVIAIPHIEGL